MAIAILAACLQLAGCSTTAPGSPSDPPQTLTPSPTPSISASVLAPALQCMDGLLLDHAVGDLSLTIDTSAGADRQTQAVVEGHLAATFSDMTRHSRAIRLVMPGPHPHRDAVAASHTDTTSPHRRRFALRVNFAPDVGVTSQGQTLGLELSLLDTGDMSIVPGTSRYNEVSLRTGSASFTKFGQAFGVAAATTPAGATRALVEVSAIELVGRLTRLPYWTCFGLDDGNDAVSAEIQEWYDGLAARPAELIGYFQRALQQRQLYGGAVDGSPNPAFNEAIARTRESLGQSREPKLSLDLFKAWLGADVASLMAAAKPSGSIAQAGAGDAPATAPDVPLVTPVATGLVTPAGTAAGQPLRLRVSADGNARRFARGEPVRLSIQPSREANVYCFLHDDEGRILRFFPNRFQRDSRVAAEAGVRLPGTDQFRLVMNSRGVTETVACFATEKDVLIDLPSHLNQADLVPLQAASLDQVRAAFINVSGGVLGQETFELRAR
jgi:hypothetical protein